MRKLINLKIYLFGLAVFLLGGCDFGDMNVSPNNPVDAPVNNLLPAAQADLVYGLGGDISQFTGIFTQQLNGVENIYISVARYEFGPNLSGRVWDRNLYPGSMNDLNIIIQKANESNSPHYRGVARILMAVALGTTVDLYNNVPYSQAFRGNDVGNVVLQPSYDQAAALYDTVQNLLNLAVVDLQAGTSFLSPTNRDDLVYGGQREQWIKAARALQARFHNHLSKLDPAGSAQRALDALAAGSFTSNADDARVVFGNTIDAAGPWYRFSLSSFENGIRVGENFVNLLQERNDPRLPFYVAPTAQGTFEGAPAGVIQVGASKIGPYYFRPEAPTNIITYAETRFIEAEAHFRLNNLEAAAAAHNEGVKASVLRVTGAANPAYEAEYASETAGTISLEKIFTQKHLALYLEPEVWTDWRRSITDATPNGIPALTPAANNFTNGQFPRRWPYPQSEFLNNQANVTAQGSAAITDRVFWDQ